jgi:hydroxyacylglutathione hydrolase
LLEEIKEQNPDEALVSTMALEKEINSFFRLQNPTVIATLQAEFPNLPDDPDPEIVFIKLRELRNKW